MYALLFFIQTECDISIGINEQYESYDVIAEVVSTTNFKSIQYFILLEHFDTLQGWYTPYVIEIGSIKRRF